MTDFAAARRMMVDGQVRTADVTDLRLLAAMLDLPRERFLPADKAALAYLDLDVAVSAPGQPARRLLKPMVLAKLIQAAAIARNAIACSMSAAAPAIRPCCWAISRVRSWAWRRMPVWPAKRPTHSRRPVSRPARL